MRHFLLTPINPCVILKRMDDTNFENLMLKHASLKPKDLVISDLKWKYLVRAVLRGKNIMIIGPSGCAKTTAARSVAMSLGRPFEKFNIGSTQDARATLVGNTILRKETGTLFCPAPFIKAITTPNTVVLLDEFTRGTHDAWNILMTVTDPIQRCLRLDEDDSGTIINVADGVCFIATANIGNEYTATKVLDKASARRFPIKLEMFPLTGKELLYLFNIKFENKTPTQEALLKTLAKISDDILVQFKLEDSPISSIIPPANMIEMAELVMDGFTLQEIAEASIYPEYSDDGGADSERSFIKSIIQKYLSKDISSPINDPLVGKKVKIF